MGELIPLLLANAPAILGFLHENHAGLLDFFTKASGGQRGPITDLLGLLGAPHTPGGQEDIVAALKDLAAAIREHTAAGLPVHPQPGA